FVVFGLFLNTATAADPPAPASTNWSGSLALGFTLTSGNSDTVLFTLTGRTTGRYDRNEILLGLDGAYGEQDSERNNGSGRVFAQYNRLFTERWYGFGRVEGFHDVMAVLPYRVTLSLGLGYYFIKSPHTTLNVEAGPGYVFERRGTNDNQFATLR